ncbi:MAG: hypothetical protein HY335_10770, partial [Deinococcus sp.]|nr:hypothetical protein [Deinococcus sp.]
MGVRARRWRGYKWMLPGMGVKRWLALAIFGQGLAGLALVQLLGPGFWRRLRLPPGLEWPVLALGLVLLVLGVRLMNRSFVSVLIAPDDLVDRVYVRRHLSRGPRVVALGG